MQFPAQTPIPFTRAGIETLPANASGCYGIFRDGQWVYVGRATCVRGRLLEHLGGGNTALLQQRPTHFVTVAHSSPEALEKALIVSLGPCCNQKVG